MCSCAVFVYSRPCVPSGSYGRSQIWWKCSFQQLVFFSTKRTMVHVLRRNNSMSSIYDPSCVMRQFLCFELCLCTNTHCSVALWCHLIVLFLDTLLLTVAGSKAETFLINPSWTQVIVFRLFSLQAHINICSCINFFINMKGFKQRKTVI